MGRLSRRITDQRMQEIVSYGSAARDAVPALKELIAALNEQCKRGEFPEGELNDRRTGAVEAAIKAIQVAKTHPKLLSMEPAKLKDSSK